MEYELVREIFNRCANNQMRDVFVDEIETEDPEAYVRALLDHGDISLCVTDCADGSVIIDADADGLHQRFSFTPV